jgi:hypothetical protein
VKRKNKKILTEKNESQGANKDTSLLCRAVIEESNECAISFLPKFE